MLENKTLDCIMNNPPEALLPLSKAFGSMIYILCSHVFKKLPLNDSMDLNLAAEVCVEFMTDYIDKDSAKYMEYDSVEEAVNTYLESCEWLVEYEVKGRKEILAYFLMFVLPAKPLLNNIYYLNNIAVQIQKKNCLAFIIEPLKLSQEEVYQTISGIDEGVCLCFGGITEELDWESKINCLLRPAFVSMLYPEILEPHFRAMTAGVALVFNFDKINSLEGMTDYMKCVDHFSRQEEYPPGFDTGKLFNYKTREEALQAYTAASTELCSQCQPDAKAVLQYLVLMILIATIYGDITEEDTPELFALVKDLARPLKLTEAELKTVIDDQVKYMDKIKMAKLALKKESKNENQI